MASVSVSFSVAAAQCTIRPTQVPSKSQYKHRFSRTSNCHFISSNRSLRLIVNCSPDSQTQEGSNLNLNKNNPDLDTEKTPKEEKIEVGWKRTKPIVFERPKGAAILAVLTRFGDVMDQKFGSVDTLAKVGGIVTEKVKEEADILRGDDDMLQLKLNELIRMVKLMEIDLRFASAARKEETLSERLQQARTHCRQAIFIANAL